MSGHAVATIQAEDIKQDYDTGKDGITMVSFEVDLDRLVKLEETIKAISSRELMFYKRRNRLCSAIFSALQEQTGLVRDLNLGLACTCILSYHNYCV